MTAPASPVRDFTVLLPPGWARVPLDDRLPLRIKQLVEERVAGASGPHQAALRAALAHELSSTLETAVRHGGLDVLLSLDPVAGEPVPASALVTHLQQHGEDEPLAGLADVMATGADGVDVHELTVVQVAGGPALRRRSTREEHVPAMGEEPAGTLRVTQLEYAVPIPGTDGLLLLSFSTPVEALAEPLVTLFDVMATSLRWVAA